MALALVFCCQQAVVFQTSATTCSWPGAVFGQLHNFVIWGAASVVVQHLGMSLSSPVADVKPMLKVVVLLMVGHLIINYLAYIISCPQISWWQATTDYQARYAFGWLYLQVGVYTAMALSLSPALRQMLRTRLIPVPSTQYRQEWVMKDRGRQVVIATNDIEYIAACDYYVRLFCQDRSYLYRESLARVEKNVDPAQFVRIHRSTIVQKDKIEVVRYDTSMQSWVVVLKSGVVFRISRSKKYEVLNMVRAAVAPAIGSN